MEDAKRVQKREKWNHTHKAIVLDDPRVCKLHLVADYQSVAWEGRREIVAMTFGFYNTFDGILLNNIKYLPNKKDKINKIEIYKLNE